MILTGQPPDSCHLHLKGRARLGACRLSTGSTEAVCSGLRIEISLWSGHESAVAANLRRTVQQNALWAIVSCAYSSYSTDVIADSYENSMQGTWLE
eukprot:6195021-Pleurochrysis_carterae.AAC.2